MAREWPTQPLGELIQNLDSLRVPLSRRERESRRGVYPYYGATGVIDRVSGFLFEGLHLLVAEDGSVERPDGTPFVQLADGKFWVSNHAHVLKGETDEDTKYIYYALSTVAIRPYVSGSVQAKLSQANLNRIPTPYPLAKADRQAIVHILGTLDDKIELNRRMSETLEAMARALFKSWFVDFDPVRASVNEPGGDVAKSLAGLFPARLVDSELGSIPEGWEVKTVEEVVPTVGGSTPSTRVSEYWEGGTIHWTTPKDLSRLASPVLLDTERKITRAGLEKIPSGLLPVGTMLMSSRAPVGYLAITQVPLAVNQGYIAIPPGGRMSPLWMLFWAQANMERIRARAGGTTFQEISKRSFRPLRVAVPPKEVEHRFVQIVEPAFKRIAANERESRILAELRNALLPKLISGESRIADPKKLIGRIS